MPIMFSIIYGWNPTLKQNTNILGVTMIHCPKKRTQNKVKDELTIL